jgi:hypothetical protein
MNVEQLAAQVARQTGIRLSAADPIFSVAAIQETLLNDAIVKLDRTVKAEADRITAASMQAVLDAKREAELLITEGGAWAEKRIKEAGQEAGAMMLADLRQELAEAKRAGRFAARAAWVAGAGCIMILSGLGGMALATIW